MMQSAVYTDAYVAWCDAVYSQFYDLMFWRNIKIEKIGKFRLDLRENLISKRMNPYEVDSLRKTVLE